MKGKSPSSQQTNFLLPGLREQLNPKIGLYRLAETINWDYFESEFSSLYSEKGRPAKPIRLMTGLLILKSLDNLSDEELVQRWVQNPYYQFFCGESEFKWSLPVDSSDLTYFRKRLGKDEVKKIFAQSVAIHGEAALEEEVLIDSTVQEKNITYPVDSKQHVKIINTCAKIAKKSGVKQRRSYLRNLGKLRYALRGGTTKEASKRRRKAARTLKTIAGRVVRELERKLSKEDLVKYQDKLDVFKKFLSQERHSKNKIYSLHKPEVVCHSKGKAHKKYEFGAKASIFTTATSGIVVGVESFSEAIHDCSKGGHWGGAPKSIC
jgi:IS5 family transposase